MAGINGLIFLLGVIFGMIIKTMAFLIGSIIKKKREKRKRKIKNITLNQRGGKKAIEAYEEWEEYIKTRVRFMEQKFLDGYLQAFA